MYIKSVAYATTYNETYCSLEYANVVWNNYTVCDINIIETVQKMVAPWVCAGWNQFTFLWNKSYGYVDCLYELNWPTLAYHHYYIADYIHSMLHKKSYFHLKSSMFLI